jgi:hypothetical protein
MSTMIQVSPRDSLGTLYNIKSEADEPEVAWADFGSLLNSIGGAELAQSVRATLVATLSADPPVKQAPPAAPDPIQQATNVVQGVFPQAEPVGPVNTGNTSQWGQPPVQPMRPAAAQAAPVAAAPSCYHGVKEYISGITKAGANAGKPWQAWACPAGRNDPTKCEKEWIRD